MFRIIAFTFIAVWVLLMPVAFFMALGSEKRKRLRTGEPIDKGYIVLAVVESHMFILEWFDVRRLMKRKKRLSEESIHSEHKKNNSTNSVQRSSND